MKLLIPPTLPDPPGLFNAATKLVGAAAGTEGDRAELTTLGGLLTFVSTQIRFMLNVYELVCLSPVIRQLPLSLLVSRGHSAVVLTVLASKPETGMVEISPLTTLICHLANVHPLPGGKQVQDKERVDAPFGAAPGTTEAIWGVAEGTINAPAELGVLTGLFKTVSVHTR